MRRLTSFLLALACLSACTARGGESAAWIFPPKTPLRIHIVNGLWTKLYRPYEGIAHAGGALLSESYTGSGRASNGFLQPRGDQGKDWISGFPRSERDLAQSHMVILSNVYPEALFRKNQASLVDFVKAGGSLLILGGRNALGKVYRDSPLAAICPVEFPGEGTWHTDLNKTPRAHVFAPGPDAKLLSLDTLPWADKPAAFYVHTVVAKPEGKVALTTDGKPLLVCGTAGRGRVAVFAGTVLGEAGDGERAFWTWTAWPRVLGATIGWLGQSTPAVSAAASQALLQQIQAADDMAIDGDAMLELEGEAPPVKGESAADAKRETILREVTARCQSKATALALLQAVSAAPGDLSRDLALQMQYTLFPFFDAAARKPALRMIDSGAPNLTALGLYILGRGGKQEDLQTLIRFYKQGRPKQKKETGDVMALMDRKVTGPANTIQQAQYDIRLAALRGMAHLRGPETLAFLKAELPKLAKNGQFSTTPGKGETYRDFFDEHHMLYQDALLAALFCGDETAAAGLVESMMINQYVMLRARIEGNKAPEALEKAKSMIPAETAFLAFQIRRLMLAPPPALPHLAQAVATVKDWRVGRIALPIFGAKDLPPDAAQALAASPVPALRRLAAGTGAMTER